MNDSNKKYLKGNAFYFKNAEGGTELVEGIENYEKAKAEGREQVEPLHYADEEGREYSVSPESEREFLDNTIRDGRRVGQMVQFNSQLDEKGEGHELASPVRVSPFEQERIRALRQMGYTESNGELVARWTWNHAGEVWNELKEKGAAENLKNSAKMVTANTLETINQGYNMAIQYGWYGLRAFGADTMSYLMEKRGQQEAANRLAAKAAELREKGRQLEERTEARSEEIGEKILGDDFTFTGDDVQTAKMKGAVKGTRRLAATLSTMPVFGALAKGAGAGTELAANLAGKTLSAAQKARAAKYGLAAIMAISGYEGQKSQAEAQGKDPNSLRTKLAGAITGFVSAIAGGMLPEVRGWGAAPKTVKKEVVENVMGRVMEHAVKGGLWNVVMDGGEVAGEAVRTGRMPDGTNLWKRTITDFGVGMLMGLPGGVKEAKAVRSAYAVKAGRQAVDAMRGKMNGVSAAEIKSLCPDVSKVSADGTRVLLEDGTEVRMGIVGKKGENPRVEPRVLLDDGKILSVEGEVIGYALRSPESIWNGGSEGEKSSEARKEAQQAAEESRAARWMEKGADGEARDIKAENEAVAPKEGAEKAAFEGLMNAAESVDETIAGAARVGLEEAREGRMTFDKARENVAARLAVEENERPKEIYGKEEGEVAEGEKEREEGRATEKEIEAATQAVESGEMAKEDVDLTNAEGAGHEKGNLVVVEKKDGSKRIIAGKVGEKPVQEAVVLREEDGWDKENSDLAEMKMAYDAGELDLGQRAWVEKKFGMGGVSEDMTWTTIERLSDEKYEAVIGVSEVANHKELGERGDLVQNALVYTMPDGATYEEGARAARIMAKAENMMPEEAWRLGRWAEKNKYRTGVKEALRRGDVKELARLAGETATDEILVEKENGEIARADEIVAEREENRVPTGEETTLKELEAKGVDAGIPKNDADTRLHGTEEAGVFTCDAVKGVRVETNAVGERGERCWKISVEDIGEMYGSDEKWQKTGEFFHNLEEAARKSGVKVAADEEVQTLGEIAKRDYEEGVKASEWKRDSELVEMMLKKAMPNVTLMTGEEGDRYIRNMAKADKQASEYTKGKLVLGVYDPASNAIAVNSRIWNTKEGAQVKIHEFSHAGLKLLRAKNAGFYNHAMTLTAETAMYRTKKEANPNVSEDVLREETFLDIVNMEVEGTLRGAVPNSIYGRLRKMVRDFITWFGECFDIKNLRPFQYRDWTVQDMARAWYASLMMERDLGGRYSVSIVDRTERRPYRSAYRTNSGMASFLEKAFRYRGETDRTGEFTESSHAGAAWDQMKREWDQLSESDRKAIKSVTYKDILAQNQLDKVINALEREGQREGAAEREREEGEQWHTLMDLNREANQEMVLHDKAQGLKLDMMIVRPHKGRTSGKITAHAMKEEKPGSQKYNLAIQTAASEMAEFVREGDVLVPAPQHTGKAEYTLDLANRIAELTGAKVADVVKGKKREMLYARKKAGEKVEAEDLGLYVEGEIPEGEVIVIDNTVDSGTTVRAVADQVGATKILAYTAALDFKNTKAKEARVNADPMFFVEDNEALQKERVRLAKIEEAMRRSDAEYGKLKDEELTRIIQGKGDGNVQRAWNELYARWDRKVGREVERFTAKRPNLAWVERQQDIKSDIWAEIQRLVDSGWYDERKMQFAGMVINFAIKKAISRYVEKERGRREVTITDNPNEKVGFFENVKAQGEDRGQKMAKLRLRELVEDEGVVGKKVVGMMLEGKTNKEMAEELGVSDGEVRIIKAGLYARMRGRALDKEMGISNQKIEGEQRRTRNDIVAERREKMVQLWEEGKSNDEIAKELNISKVLLGKEMQRMKNAGRVGDTIAKRSVEKAKRDQRVRALWEEGRTEREIAETLGVTEAQARMSVDTLVLGGAIESPAEKKARMTEERRAKVAGYKDKGWSEREIAKAIGCSQSAVHTDLKWLEKNRPMFATKDVFHGSAADFLKPDLHYVGTGEGTHVYGWGLYGTEVREIADRYAKIASDKNKGVWLDGKKWSYNETKDPIEKEALRLVGSCGGSTVEAREVLREQIEDNRRFSKEFKDWDPAEVEELEKERQWIEKNEARIDYRPDDKYVYEQEMFQGREGIKDDQHLMNWNEVPSWTIRKAILKAGGIKDRWIKEMDVPYSEWKTWKAGRLYEMIAHWKRSEKAATEWLASLGVDGIKYPADSYMKQTKNGDEVGWNYVSFRDDNIEVKHKWVNGEQLFYAVPKTGSMWLRGKVRVADSVPGMGEQDRGPLAASHELSEAEAATPYEMKGEERKVSLPLSEIKWLMDQIKMDDVKSVFDEDGDLKTVCKYADYFGLVDRSDLEKVKSDLKRTGYFKNEDLEWVMVSGPNEIENERNLSERKLVKELKRIGSERLNGTEAGGWAGSRSIYADKLAQMVLEQKTSRIRRTPSGEIVATVGAELEQSLASKAVWEEAQRFADWAFGEVKDETGARIERGAQDLEVKMASAFLTMPETMERMAPETMKGIWNAVAANERTRKAYLEMVGRVVGGEADQFALKRIEEDMSRERAQKIRELEMETEKPISAGSRMLDAWETIKVGLHDRMSPVLLRVNRNAKEYVEAKRAAIKGYFSREMKKAAKEEIEVFERLVERNKAEYMVARTQYERGTWNRARVYSIKMLELENESTLKWGLQDKEKSLFMTLQRIVELQGRAAPQGMSPMQAKRILERWQLEKPEQYRNLTEYSRRFESIIEQEIIDDKNFRQMFGGHFMEYCRSQAHYVTMKNTLSAEEVKAWDKRMAACGVKPTDELWVKLAKYAATNFAGTDAEEFRTLLKGHLGSRKEVRAATMEKHMEAARWAYRNSFIISLKNLLVAAHVEGVASYPRVAFKDTARYGFIDYLDHGKKMTLRVPRAVADGLAGEARMSEWGRWANELVNNLYINWNMRYMPNNINRNVSSMEKNMPGVTEGALKTGARALGGGAVANLTQVAANVIARHLNERNLASVGMRYLAGGRDSALWWVPEAQRIARFIEDPNAWQKEYWKARKANDKDRQYEMERDRQKAFEILKEGNMLLTYFTKKEGAEFESDIKNFFSKQKLKRIEDIEREYIRKQEKKLGRVMTAAEKVNVFSMMAKQAEHEDNLIKIMAYLHDRYMYETGRTNRTPAESGVLAGDKVGIKRSERAGRYNRGIQTVMQKYFNQVEKGFTEYWKNFGRKGKYTQGTLESSAKFGRVLASRLMGMALSYGLVRLVMLKNANGDEEEAKKKYGKMYDFAKFRHDAWKNMDNYTRKHCDFMPIWNSKSAKEGGDGGYTTIGLSLPRSDEDTIIGRFADLLMEETMNKLGVGEKAKWGDAMMDMIKGGLIPDIGTGGSVLSFLQDALMPWQGEVPYNSYYGKQKLDQRKVAARNESIEAAMDLMKDQGMLLWEDFGGGNFLSLKGHEMGDAKDVAGGALDVAENKIPMFSPLFARIVKVQVGSPDKDLRRLEAVRGDVAAKKAAAIEKIKGDKNYIDKDGNPWWQRDSAGFGKKMEEVAKQYGLERRDEIEVMEKLWNDWGRWMEEKGMGVGRMNEERRVDNSIKASETYGKREIDWFMGR